MVFKFGRFARSTQILIQILAASLLPQGCDNDGELLPDRQVPWVEQKSHSLKLSEEELRSLDERQATLTTVWTAFLRAAEAREAYAQTLHEESASDESIYGELQATAQRASGDWYLLSRPIRDATIGYAWEGRRGELLHCDSNASGAVSIVRNGENLELLKSDKEGALYFIGVVRKSGEYIKIDRFREDGVNTEFAPYFWNSFAEDGAPVALSKDSPVLTSNLMRPARPRKSVGWLFPTSDGDFVCVAEQIEAIGNVLWVVRNGRGFDILHSGPDLEGCYARISSDCVIHFDKVFDDSITANWSDATWNILYHDDAPAFDANALSGHVLLERLESVLKTRIGNGGVISFRFPPVQGCI